MAAFDEAQAETDAAKAAALAALAAGGSGALAEHEAAVRQSAAMKLVATEGALRRAAGINAEAAGDAIAKGGSLVGRPEAVPGMSTSNVYDRYAQDQQRAGAARQQAMADLAAGNANYFAQVNASRPAVEAHAASALAKLREKEAEEGSIAAILKELGGVGMAQGFAETYPGNQRFVPQPQVVTADKKFNPVEAKPGTFNFRGDIKPRQPTAQEAAEDFGAVVGLPSGAGRALLGAPKEVTPKQGAHRTDVTSRVQQHANPNTADTFLNIVAGEPATDTDKAIPPARSLAEAVKKANAMSDDALKAAGVSRDALVRWLTDYFAV